ncbi:MAG TPA: glycine zipper 2TM domain-containing protein [Albitalea sp.]|nr:glycine zipper 2TM domain-containing protein [Albitalea sp.]
MTRKLMTLCAFVSPLVIAVGCSSVNNPPTPTYGTVGSSPAYASSGTYDSVQYGTVRNIQQLDSSRRGPGAGALLGAVVGGVVGNQIGHGTGRAAATALGAVGGAVAGNAYDQRNATPQTYYQVDVRLDNGDFRSFDYMDLNGLRVGDRVRIQDGQLQRW